MGQVWKATDPDLGRDVAIKLLPEAFAADAERLARFEREARLLATLDHPNIASIYGLHDAEGARFLAMELVVGEDLSQRLARGPLPMDDALETAAQICQALEAANDAGVVHRDLKPANVMLTADGKVKVLDFGLAKALIGDPASGSSASMSMSPTMTSAGTQAGMILGTAAYMSPEQARGKPVDRRADIWALGCVTYEMLCGKAPFSGETITDTLAAVVRAEPDWDALPADTPNVIRKALRRALQKDPAKRLRDAGDLRLEIEEALAGESDDTAEPTAAPRSPVHGILWAIGGALIMMAAMFAFRGDSNSAAVDNTTATRFEVIAAPGQTQIDNWSLRISPDGNRVAWVVIDGARRSIHLRGLDSLEIQELPDTEAAKYPTFSPDSRSLAFFAGGKLRRLDIGSRRAIDLCDALDGAGITWVDDDTIYFNDAWIGALKKISADGGTSEVATTLDREYGEIGHWFPQALPGGKQILISRWRTSLNDMTVAVVDLDSGEIRDLIQRASHARFVPPASLLFTQAGAIQVVDFDPKSLQVSGDPRLLVDGVKQQWDNGYSPWSVSTNGTLVYQDGSLWSTKRSIVSVDHDGNVTPLDVEPAAYVHAAITPDGRRLAATRFDNGRANVVVFDLERGVNTPMPMDGVNAYPVWNPSGEELVFDTSLKGPWDIYRYSVEGGGKPTLLVEGIPDQTPLAWTPDGRSVVWKGRDDTIYVTDVVAGGEPDVLKDIGADDLSISPDGEWCVYRDGIAGRTEVMLRRFPDGQRVYRVSKDGGGYPLWGRDGREVLFRRGDAVISASFRAENGEPVIGRPKVLFRSDELLPMARNSWSYDRVHDRMIMIQRGDREVNLKAFVVLQNWQAARQIEISQ